MHVRAERIRGIQKLDHREPGCCRVGDMLTAGNRNRFPGRTDERLSQQQLRGPAPPVNGPRRDCQPESNRSPASDYLASGSIENRPGEL
jgi:hypothetical protein